MSDDEEIYGGAPLDIQIEIIKRLPIKSLIKCLSVSKSWKSIIQSSPFIADFNRSHNQQPHNQFFVGYRDKNYVNIYDDDTNRFHQHHKFPRSPHDLGGDFRSIGYSQGLFGFHSYKKDSVFIWNPSIRKSVAIPVPGHREADDFGFTVVCNATEPTIFKIAYIPRLQVDFYTLSTRIWTSMRNDPGESLGFTGTWVVIDRFIHWVAYYEGDHCLILSFDITSQHFTELCLPPALAPHPSSPGLKLGLSKRKDSLVVLERYESEQEIGLWMMIAEPGVLIKIYTVKPPSYRLILESVLGFSKDGQPIVIINVCDLCWILFFYKPDFGGISGKRRIDLAGSYMETLLLLDH